MNYSKFPFHFILLQHVKYEQVSLITLLHFNTLNVSCLHQQISRVRERIQNTEVSTPGDKLHAYWISVISLILESL